MYMKIKSIMAIMAISVVALAACQESVDERAAREAKEFTRKNCPTPIVNNTRIDSLVYEESTHTIHYYRTLFNDADNADAIRNNEAALREALVREFKSSASIKMYVEAGMNFKLTYHSGSNPQQVLYGTTLSAADISR